MLLQLDPNSGMPLYRQMVQQLQQRIIGGQLQAGSQLPSARELSAQVKVNFLTVAKVYQQLEQQGLVEMRRGLGTFVSFVPQKTSDEDKINLLRPMVRDLVRAAQQLGVSDEQIKEFVATEFKQQEKAI